MEPISVEDRLTTLRAAWPAWEFWTVSTWDGHQSGVVWCATNGRGVVLNAHEATHLAEYVSENERPGSVWG